LKIDGIEKGGEGGHRGKPKGNRGDRSKPKLHLGKSESLIMGYFGRGEAHGGIKPEADPDLLKKSRMNFKGVRKMGD